MHQSFINYRNYRALKGAVVLCVSVLILYLLAQPVATANGGTWLGYLGGTLGGVIILWLACLGIRKRKYRDTELRAVGWVSTHIYLGTALLLIVSLHSGFHIGFNIHSLAYILTVLVVITGFYGLFAYSVYPTKITLNRDGMSRDSMFSEIAEIDEKCLGLSEKLSPKIFAKISENVEETRVKSDLLKRLFSDRSPRDRPLRQTVSYMRKEIKLNKATGSDAPVAHEILGLLQDKQTLVDKIELDIRYHFRLDWWLYLHVPLTIGLLLSLIIHIFIVLYYW